jgi:hypothetical protein
VYSGSPDPSPCDVCPVPADGQSSDCQYASGDLNCDFRIDTNDVFRLLYYFAGLSIAPAPPRPGIATGVYPFGDLNCDGRVDARDVVKLFAALSGIPTPLKEGCRAILN